MSMGAAVLTEKAVRETEELFRLRREAITLLSLVVAEWTSDPTSTACFDMRIVMRSQEVLKRIGQLSVEL